MLIYRLTRRSPKLQLGMIASMGQSHHQRLCAFPARYEVVRRPRPHNRTRNGHGAENHMTRARLVLDQGTKLETWGRLVLAKRAPRWPARRMPASFREVFAERCIGRATAPLLQCYSGSAGSIGDVS